MTDKPEVRRLGDDISFAWQGGLRAEVRDIDRGRDGPKAEVRIWSELTGHLSQAHLNLMSSSGRETLRKALERRDQETDWQAFVEQICVLAVELWREGEPFVKIEPRLRDNETAHLIRPLLPANIVTLLFGDGGSGKSMLAQAVACALARGEGFGSMWAAGPSAVGYADWETDAEEFGDRLARLGMNGTGDVWYRRCTAPLHELARRIKKEADELEISVMVYDSLGFASGGDMKDAEIVLRTFSAIRYIGRPGLLVHHIPKESKEPYGSVYVRNAARNAWTIARAMASDDEMTVAVIHRKSNNSRLLDPIGLRFAFGAEETLIERTDAKPALLELGEGSKTDRVLAVLAEGEYTPAEVAAGLGDKDSRNVSTILGRLVKKGKAVRGADGRYTGAE